MGIPAAFKRIRTSPTPQKFVPPGMGHQLMGSMDTRDTRDTREWSPLLNTSNDNNSSSGAKALPFSFAHRLPDLNARDTDGAPTAGLAHEAEGEGEEQESHMDRLPDALLLKIVQMSQPTAWDLCRMSCVSKGWQEACSHVSFWTRLRVGSGSLRPGVEQLAHRCTQLTELFVDDPRCELHILHPIIIACGQSLRRVVIDCDRDVGSQNEASISSVLWLISLYCKNVESIELQSSGQESSIGSLEGRTMWFLTSAFRNIRYFACLPRGALTKQCIYLMAIAWRHLECVRINMESLSLEDLTAFRKCTHLRALELVGGSLEQLSGTPNTAESTSPERNRDTTGILSAPHQSSSGSGLSWQSQYSSIDTPMDYQGQSASDQTEVFLPSLELLVLNRVHFDSSSVASLALMCPSVKRILVSGSLCSSCLTRNGACNSHTLDCVRRRVDEIQRCLLRTRVSMHH